MQELIAAAKVVCDLFDYTGTVEECEAVNRLIAAVERAENPPTDYNEWTSKNSGKVLSAHEVWIAAQQAERERCREIVLAMGGPDVPDLLRQIDSGED